MAITSFKQSPILWFGILVVAAVIWHVRADVADDKKQCQGRLVSELSTCLTFVSAESKYPTPTCCKNLNDNYDINMRTCLCVVIRDRNDPKLGFKINATLALSLPYLCHVSSANVSTCPDLLHMDRNSSDAQIFLQFNSTSAVNDLSTSSNGTMKINGVGFGTTGLFFLWIAFSLIFSQI